MERNPQFDRRGTWSTEIFLSPLQTQNIPSWLPRGNFPLLSTLPNSESRPSTPDTNAKSKISSNPTVQKFHMLYSRYHRIKNSSHFFTMYPAVMFLQIRRRIFLAMFFSICRFPLHIPTNKRQNRINPNVCTCISVTSVRVLCVNNLCNEW